ncbi:MAG: CDP-archaeol synthase [Gammaproteobacteria bacterium]|nr:CDP-archaeol synthase [Pseudomonadales bacterium]MCP5346419.1 CDP-archaeol synthase [Pseudomonadales bacterium]
MLLQRVLTAIVLIAGLVLLSVFSSPFWFAVVVAVVTLLAAMEWTRFIGLDSVPAKVGYLLSLSLLLVGAFFLVGASPETRVLDFPRVVSLLAFGVVFWLLATWLLTGYPENTDSWNDQSHIALMGVFVLLPTWCGITQLKYIDESGFLVLGLIALVSVADIGAYFSGRAWGRRKLAPSLSPGKSWAGFWGGMASSVILASIFMGITSVRGAPLTLTQGTLGVIGTLLVAVSSVVGDLFESMLKRNRNLKDSGATLPGHGGILDRIDSLTAATPFAVLWLFLVLGLGSGPL